LLILIGYSCQFQWNFLLHRTLNGNSIFLKKLHSIPAATAQSVSRCPLCCWCEELRVAGNVCRRNQWSWRVWCNALMEVCGIFSSALSRPSTVECMSTMCQHNIAVSVLRHPNYSNRFTIILFVKTLTVLFIYFICNVFVECSVIFTASTVLFDRNCWGSWLYPLSWILKTRTHDVSEAGSVFGLRWWEENIYTVGPLKRANLNHWTNWS
jgi:hypothetical protein